LLSGVHHKSLTQSRSPPFSPSSLSQVPAAMEAGGEREEAEDTRLVPCVWDNDVLPLPFTPHHPFGTLEGKPPRHCSRLLRAISPRSVVWPVLLKSWLLRGLPLTQGGSQGPSDMLLEGRLSPGPRGARTDLMEMDSVTHIHSCVSPPARRAIYNEPQSSGQCRVQLDGVRCHAQQLQRCPNPPTVSAWAHRSCVRGFAAHCQDRRKAPFPIRICEPMWTHGAALLQDIHSNLF